MSRTDQSTFGSSGGKPSKTGAGILAADVIRVFATKHDPDSVADKLSAGPTGLAASRLTQLQLQLAKTEIPEQPKPTAATSQLQSTTVDYKLMSS